MGLGRWTSADCTTNHLATCATTVSGGGNGVSMLPPRDAELIEFASDALGVWCQVGSRVVLVPVAAGSNGAPYFFS